MNYVVQDTSLTAVADAIRKQTKSTEQIPFPNGFVSEIGKIDAESSYNNGYQQGYTEGEEQGYSQGLTEGFDNGRELLLYATSLSSMFKKATFPENSKLTLNIPNCLDLNATFNQTKNIKELKLISNNEALMSFYFTFQDNIMIEVIDISEFSPKIERFYSAFTGNANLVEIRGEIDLSETIDHTNNFTYLGKLQEVRFKANTAKASFGFRDSSKLSNESVQSIINGLADLTGASAQTLTLHTTVKAKLTEAQIAAITSKNWNLA